MKYYLKKKFPNSIAKAVQGIDLKLSMVHIYDPKDNLIFLEENVEFSWYNSMNLPETGECFHLVN